MKPVVLAVTGASGAIYGRALLQALTSQGRSVELVVSPAGQRVAKEELDFSYEPESLAQLLGDKAKLVNRHPYANIGASIASGSFPCHGMAVVPCSMGTVGRVASGISQNLVERAAEVQLKERRPLVLLFRESPLSVLHLENLLRLARAGATVLPAAPGYYAKPQTIDDLVRFLVERCLQSLGVLQDAKIQWTGETP